MEKRNEAWYQAWNKARYKAKKESGVLCNDQIIKNLFWQRKNRKSKKIRSYKPYVKSILVYDVRLGDGQNYQKKQ